MRFHEVQVVGISRLVVGVRRDASEAGFKLDGGDGEPKKCWLRPLAGNLLQNLENTRAVR